MTWLLGLWLAGAPLQQPEPGQIPALIEQLRSDRADQRDEAARKLATLGKAAVPALEKAAGDADPEVASRARQLLRRIALRDRIPALLRQSIPDIEDRLVSEGDRAWAGIFLQVAAKVDGLYSPNLLEGLAGPALRGATTPEERQKVCSTVAAWDLRSAIPELLRLLADDSALARGSAARALGEMKAKEAPAFLLPLLKDRDAEVRQQALYALAALSATDAAPKMIGLLRDEDAGVRETAADVLARLGAREAIPGILAHLKDEAPRVRWSAIGQLSTLKAVEAAPELIPLLRHEDSSVRVNALWALQSLDAKEAIPHFIRLMEDEEQVVRGAAVEALGWLGVPKAAPQIRAALRDKSSYVRMSAVHAVGRLQVKEAIPDIVQLVDENMVSCVGNRAMDIAGVLRSLDLKPSIAELRRRLGEAKSDIARQNAAAILAELNAEEALPDLMKLLQDPAPRVRNSGIRALDRMVARSAIPELLRFLKDDDDGVRIAAVQAMGTLSAKEAVPQLEALLQQPNSSIRVWTLEALKDIGARESIPQMIKATEDPDYSVRQHAIQALAHLGAKEAIPAIAGRLLDDGARTDAFKALDLLDAKEAMADVLPLLKDPHCFIRVSAAAWLCGMGSREGVAVLLEDSRDLTPLNALRRPEDWHRLHRREWLIAPHRSTTAVMDFLEKELGLPLELPPGLFVSGWRINSNTWKKERTTVLGELRAELGRERCQAILEKDRIRAVPYAEALAFWKKWRDESK